jgi:hypothetical protein
VSEIMENPSSPGRDETPAPPAAPPELSLETVTRRVRADRFLESGIENVRVLDMAQFRSLFDRLVEEKVGERLATIAAAGPAPDDAGRGVAVETLREEYRKRWDDFRGRYEEKIRRLEEKLLEAVGR